jgi:TetR/AcrR family transcriptional regulator
MMSEASNFPELAAFYEREVIEPGSQLIQRILQRGISSGEFAPLDLHYGVYTLLAPMLFLATWKHSFGACPQFRHVIDPQEYLRVQSEIILRGLAATPNPIKAT